MKPGLKLDTKNRLRMVSKVRNVRLGVFSGGGCHHPNNVNKYGYTVLLNVQQYLSQNAKRASARKDTGLDQSLFSVQLFRLRINIMKVLKGSI